MNSVCQVANVPRIMEGGDVGVLESEMARTIFTHHQKFVLTDAEDSDSGKRKLFLWNKLGLLRLCFDYFLFKSSCIKQHNQDRTCKPTTTSWTEIKTETYNIKLEIYHRVYILLNNLCYWRRLIAFLGGIDLTDGRYEVDIYHLNSQLMSIGWGILALFPGLK